jgi:sialate O-acetylesterase
MTTRFLYTILALAALALPALRAELKLPAIIGDHMVLQQKLANPIWGWDSPGAKVTVAFGDETHETRAGSDGRWTVRLAPHPANSTPATLTITGSSTVTIRDVLVGEVWVCSGQSNMQFDLIGSYTGDLEAAASDYPAIRLITVAQVGALTPQNDFKGAWTPATPTSTRQFSAVGFLYGRFLHQILKVPVGLIDVSFGSSPAEAWIRREALERDPRFSATMAAAAKQDAHYTSPAGQEDFAKSVTAWAKQNEAARAAGKTPPFKPRFWMDGPRRPGNLFAGMLHPLIGYGIKGAIWYQGEANAARAWEYNELFPFLITQWRQEWGQGDFPFYWAQLADHGAEKDAPGDSRWAEAREAQSKTLRVANTGQAVTINLGEGRDIHPRAKYDVAARLVRWALVKDYGLDFPYRSPEFKSLEITGAKALVTLDCFDSSLYAFDTPAPVGFAICGPDKVWHWAQAAIKGTAQVEVWSDAVPAPVAVRYAWADNPRCNLYARHGLPVTPFRTDNFEPVTKLGGSEKSEAPSPP